MPQAAALGWTIRIELAGVPAEVVCRYQRNEAFFLNYTTDKPPLFTIAPTEADIEKMRSDVIKAVGEEELPKPPGLDVLLENHAIHSLLSEKMTEYHVLLMHGSALCMDGEAYIFTAPSGTGKSTHSRFWRETFGDRVWMINDDKPMLRIEDGRVTVYGTPWNGKHNLSRNACAPLKAIVWLNRDERNHIEPMGKADAFPLLISQCFGSKNSLARVRILELEKALLNAVDFYKLGCNLDPDAARTAWEGIQQSHAQLLSYV